MRKLYILTLLLLLLPFIANAQEVEIDGINYNLIPKAKLAEVIKKSSGYYTGGITIPSTITFEETVYNVTGIADKAFQYCYSLTSIKIPNSVTSIGGSAFSNCSSLTSITIPNSVTSIGSSAFWGCSSLTSIEIPNSVTSIGSSAFKGCSSLTSIEIPNSVTSIEYAFYGCSGLTSITIPNSVTSIGANAFFDCTSLTSITIPNSVTSIGRSAFSGCSSLTSIEIPNSVTSIGSSAFKGCSSLTSITIPNSVTSIEYAFQDCSGLTSITISNGVTNISSSAFSGCSSLTSITIPNSVKSIGNKSFSGCKSLTSIKIPNSVTSIGHEAFSSCSSLTSIEIPNSVTSIGDLSFFGCSSLTSITIPNSVTSIRLNTFFNCSSLTSIEIPNSVTSIGRSAFYNCSSLTSITIPNSVTSIGSYAFQSCSSLTSIEIPNSVTSIYSYTFSGCSSLTSITIGKSVKNIYQKAFEKCKNLTDVTCLAKEVPSTNSDAFNESYIEYATLHVPEGSVAAYKAKAPWSGFKEFVLIAETKYTLTYQLDGEEYKTYQLAENDAITPESAPTKEGYTFSGWSEIPATMPAKDLTVTGTFTINKYKLTYKVDDTTYKTYEIEYGSSLTPESAPTKKGYTFSGWSEIPATMPAKDLTVTGTFIINKYKLTYKVDDTTYKTYEVEYGSSLTPEPAPTKDGYIFLGWSTIPATMPAENLTITGNFEEITTEDVITLTEKGKGQSTWCSKYDLNFKGVEGIKAYTATGYNVNTGLIMLTRIYDVPAGTGIMLIGNPDEYKIPHTVSETYYSNMFVGVLEATTVPETSGDYVNYYLSAGAQGVGFYRVNGSVSLKANRAYLPARKTLPGSASTRGFIGFEFSDDTTALDSAPAAIPSAAPDVYYNLQGQRVDKPTKGLYIKNGKKVIVK